MRALIIGLSIVGTAVAATPSIHFSRVYTTSETETHKFNLVADKLKLGLEETILLTVKQIGQDKAPSIVVIESDQHRAVSGDAGPKPETLTAAVDRHNMPKGLSMTGNNYIFLLESLAGFTPDRDVDVGDSCVIEYANPKEALKIHGRQTITRINEKAHTISAHIAATISLDDQPLGKASFDSVYDLSRGMLLTSNGSFGIPKLSYVIVINPD